MTLKGWIGLFPVVSLTFLTAACFSIDGVEGSFAQDAMMRQYPEPVADVLMPVDREKGEGNWSLQSTELSGSRLGDAEVLGYGPVVDPEHRTSDRDIGVGCTLTPADWRDELDWPVAVDTAICESTWLGVLRMDSLDSPWVSLAQRWIAAELNRASGASVPSDVDDVLYGSEVLLVASCEGLSDDDWDFAMELAETISGYNNGQSGPGLCDQ
jgi:hypothetical protein